MMNPISGTFRHDRPLLDFLADQKEIDELYMSGGSL